jgi:hypothetical protein
MRFIKFEPMSEKLVSSGKEPLPENSKILKHFDDTLRVLKYTDSFSIQLDLESYGIHVLISYSVHGRFRSIGVHEDRWDGENTLHFLILDEKYCNKEDIVIPILSDEETLDRIDQLVRNRL